MKWDKFGSCGYHPEIGWKQWSNIAGIVQLSLKWERCHCDEFFISSHTEGCHNDNFRCSQWWKFRQNDISVSVNISYMALAFWKARGCCRPNIAMIQSESTVYSIYIFQISTNAIVIHAWMVVFVRTMWTPTRAHVQRVSLEPTVTKVIFCGQQNDLDHYANTKTYMHLCIDFGSVLLIFLLLVLVQHILSCNMN